MTVMGALRAAALVVLPSTGTQSKCSNKVLNMLLINGGLINHVHLIISVPRYWRTVIILSWSMAGRTKQHKPEDNNLESQYLHRCKSWGGLKLEDGIMKFKQLGC